MTNSSSRLRDIQNRNRGAFALGRVALVLMLLGTALAGVGIASAPGM